MVARLTTRNLFWRKLLDCDHSLDYFRAHMCLLALFLKLLQNDNILERRRKFVCKCWLKCTEQAWTKQLGYWLCMLCQHVGCKNVNFHFDFQAGISSQFSAVSLSLCQSRDAWHRIQPSAEKRLPSEYCNGKMKQASSSCLQTLTLQWSHGVWHFWQIIICIWRQNFQFPNNHWLYVIVYS